MSSSNDYTKPAILAGLFLFLTLVYEERRRMQRRIVVATPSAIGYGISTAFDLVDEAERTRNKEKAKEALKHVSTLQAHHTVDELTFLSGKDVRRLLTRIHAQL